jgi:Domain of unknown function (DUF1906)
MPTNTLAGVVAAAASGLHGFDADTVITADFARQLKQAGYAFCARYLSLDSSQDPGDLSNDEATGILDAGLALIAVQHVMESPWSPTSALGTTNGTNAAGNAGSIGLPKGMNLWCDLEGVAEEASAQDVIAYCESWFDAVNESGYVPGLYVGANCALDGDQLYDLSFQHYWKSMSDVPEIPIRGYQLVQLAETTVQLRVDATPPVQSIGIDTDTTQTDMQGGNVLWLKIT